MMHPNLLEFSRRDEQGMAAFAGSLNREQTLLQYFRARRLPYGVDDVQLLLLGKAAGAGQADPAVKQVLRYRPSIAFAACVERL